MRHLHRIVTGAALGFIAPTAIADVTIRQETVEQPQAGVLRSVVYIKGNRLRMDSMSAEGTSSVIIDLAGRQYIVLLPALKQAFVDPLTRIDRASRPARVNISPTGESRQISGQRAHVHAVAVRLHGDDEMSTELTARAAIVPGSPGAAEYSSFFLAAADYAVSLHGVDLGGDDGESYGDSDQGRGFAELYRAFAGTGGIAYEIVSEVRTVGSIPNVSPMNEDRGPPNRTTVKSVGTAPLSDALFAVPRGYSTRSAFEGD